MSIDNTTKASKLCAFITGACAIGLVASLLLNWCLYTGKLIIPDVDYLTTIAAQQDFKQGR